MYAAVGARGYGTFVQQNLGLNGANGIYKLGDDAGERLPRREELDGAEDRLPRRHGERRRLQPAAHRR